MIFKLRKEGKELVAAATIASKQQKTRVKQQIFFLIATNCRLKIINELFFLKKQCFKKKTIHWEI